MVSTMKVWCLFLDDGADVRKQLYSVHATPKRAERARDKARELLPPEVGYTLTIEEREVE